METETVRVWDPLVRVFHWALVLAFTVAYLSAEEIETLHVWAGYTVLGLILFRLLWGLVGTRHARFTDFVYRPRAVLAYLRELATMHPRRYLGHNPAGGWMVVALLAALLLTTVTGLATYGVAEGAGPLAAMGGWGHAWKDIFKETHEFFANFTLFLVFVHIAGVVVSSFLHGENLVRAMVNGRKPKALH